MATPQSPANAAQIEFWNGPTGQRWTRLSKSIEDNLRPFTEAVLQRLAPQPGERIVDIGCGGGDTTLALAERVQGHGFVLGVDVSRPLLQRATARAANTPEYPVRFVEADAAGYAFERGSFDALFSRFGVMFFADPTAAFANVRRAVRPGAALSFICWQEIGKNPWVLVPLGAVARHVQLPPPPAPGEPGPFSFGDAARVRGILEGAGWTRVRLDSWEPQLSLGGNGSLDDAVRFAMEVGPTSRLLADVADDVKSRARDSVREALAPLFGPEGVRLPGSCWLITARNGR